MKLGGSVTMRFQSDRSRVAVSTFIRHAYLFINSLIAKETNKVRLRDSNSIMLYEGAV